MNIIELAKQANGGSVWIGMEWLWEELQKFADLVEAAARADEREECAKIAEIAEPYQAADLIRARGEA
jgi:hypothetical protein